MPLTRKTFILLTICAISFIVIALLDAVPQDPQYHQFADQRAGLGVPNLLNVVSNLFFALIGIAGLLRLWLGRSLVIIDSIFAIYPTFFAALVMIALGSAYYHWSPDNQSLVWDRLPMTVAFMSFFALILAERLSLRLAKFGFLPLLMAGVLSIVYWHQTESVGQGDLRAYILIQFLPLLLTPVILLMFKPAFSHDRAIWWFLGCYLMAKLLEVFDEQIFDWLTLVSGHSLKHLAAAIGCLIYLRYLQYRKPLVDPAGVTQ